MRSIYVEDGLRVSFPGRDEEFDQGVEMGIAIALMAAGQDFISGFQPRASNKQTNWPQEWIFTLCHLAHVGKTGRSLFEKVRGATFT